MSAATADRLLRAHCRTTARSLSTTKAGPLLKQQIPIRTFAQWDEAQPGFLEADLVAHCGGHLEGGCLYTLTLTDVATGWTECLPLLNWGREVVLTALQRARMLFPFPILGIDTDNGGEFIQENTHVLNRRSTSKDPFADQWEHILSWVQANPTRSSGDIFRQLQSLFPGRYQPLHIRSLQRGMRRIR